MKTETKQTIRISPNLPETLIPQGPIKNLPSIDRLEWVKE